MSDLFRIQQRNQRQEEPGRRKVRMITNLRIDEFSGVDHPANLAEGWWIMKSAGEPRIEIEELNEGETTVRKTVSAEPQRMNIMQAALQRRVDASPRDQRDALVKQMDDPAFRKAAANTFEQKCATVVKKYKDLIESGDAGSLNTAAYIAKLIQTCVEYEREK